MTQKMKRATARKLYALLTVCLLAAPVLAQTALDWHPYKSDSLGFTITFPTAQVEAQPVRVDEKAGVKIETYIFMARSGEVVSLVGCTDYPVAELDVQRELELDRDNFVKAISGAVVSDRKFIFGVEKLAAMEFSFTSGENVGKSLIVVKKFPGRFSAYQTVFLFPKSGNYSADMEKFNASFKLINRTF